MLGVSVGSYVKFVKTERAVLTCFIKFWESARMLGVSFVDRVILLGVSVRSYLKLLGVSIGSYETMLGVIFAVYGKCFELCFKQGPHDFFKNCSLITPPN